MPIIVAVNKIDKPESDPDRVKRELSNHGLVPEDWGGQTIFVPTSAKKGTGIEQLLEMTALQAEILELKANPSRAARGVIIEGRLDRGRGPVATVLIQNGHAARRATRWWSARTPAAIRALIDDRRQEGASRRARRIRSRSSACRACRRPATCWWSVVRRAQGAADRHHARRPRQAQGQGGARGSRWRTCRSRSRRARSRSCGSSSRPTCRARWRPWPSRSSACPPTRSSSRSSTARWARSTRRDVMLASASNAIVLGFNVKAEPKAASPGPGQRRGPAQLQRHLRGDQRRARRRSSGMLAPEIRETIAGPGPGAAAVPHLQARPDLRLDGHWRARSSAAPRCACKRGETVLGEGTVTSLKRFKDDVREVLAGPGVRHRRRGVKDIQPGDILEAFTTEEVARTL